MGNSANSMKLQIRFNLSCYSHLFVLYLPVSVKRFKLPVSVKRNQHPFSNQPFNLHVNQKQHHTIQEQCFTLKQDLNVTRQVHQHTQCDHKTTLPSVVFHHH